ncbi:MAG: HAD family hydrolase [Bryobacteraceae bacterium]
MRALVFDVDGTMYDQNRLRMMLAPQLAGYALRRPLAAWRAVRTLMAWRESLEELRWARRPVSVPRAQMEAAMRATGYAEAQVAAVVERWFEAAPLPLLRRCLRPGLTTLLDAAAAGGTPCAVFSDYDAGRKLEAMGIANRFAAVLCAADPQVQAYKPDPKGLRLLLERLGVRARDAAYLGDRPEIDGAAARAAGVRFVRIGPQGFTPQIISGLTEVS